VTVDETGQKRVSRPIVPDTWRISTVGFDNR